MSVDERSPSPTIPSEPQLFAIGASRPFAEKMAARCGLSLTEIEERSFEDGEHKIRPLENVRGRDVFVVHSLYGERDQTVNDKLMRLFCLIGAVKDAGAARVTAITPYLAYARKDRRTKPRDPVTHRYVAKLFEAVATDRIIALEIHNLAAFENAFDRCRPEHVPSARLFADHFSTRLDLGSTAVVSPDPGGIKRADLFRQALEAASEHCTVPMAFLEKRRSGGIVSGDTLTGDVRGRTAIIFDDLISSGTTMLRAAESCRAAGAQRVIAVAAHGLFMGNANAVFSNPAIDEIVISDAVPPFRLTAPEAVAKLDVISAAPLFGQIVQRLHSGGSVEDLIW
jgi:ribose-phosphate pyrophosphokinase